MVSQSTERADRAKSSNVSISKMEIRLVMTNRLIISFAHAAHMEKGWFA